MADNKRMSLDEVYGVADAENPTVTRLEYRNGGERVRQETSIPVTTFTPAGIVDAMAKESTGSRQKLLGKRGDATATVRQTIGTMKGDRARSHAQEIFELTGVKLEETAPAPTGETAEETAGNGRPGAQPGNDNGAGNAGQTRQPVAAGRR